MPQYLFRCMRCSHERLISLSIANRDGVAIWCQQHDCKPVVAGGVCRMERVPTPVNFTIGGYNAKNGYSK